MILLFLTTTQKSFSFFQATENQDYREFSGEVRDSDTRDELVLVDLEVEGTNIRTVTNNEGEFILKVPLRYLNSNLVLTSVGYQTKVIPISSLSTSDNDIRLERSITELKEVNINVPSDANKLVLEMLSRIEQNYLTENVIMTAFYRETIRKRRQDASLAEAVVEIYKQPYTSSRNDRIKLIKSRKNTNYSKLDTLALKLQGGPFNTLYSDLIKYPEFVFSEEFFAAYDFEFENTTRVDGRSIFVVSFKQKPEVITPLYYGKLYIDTKSYALISAVYNLNVENEDLAADIFVKRKPRRVTVFPTEAAYRVDYKFKNGKWHYGYSNILLTFKVDWKGKLFNSVYTLQSEMVITDWEFNESENLRGKEQIRPNVILADEASGFADPEFWGEYNIIEPEKSIEQAIRKINRNLNREK